MATWIIHIKPTIVSQLRGHHMSWYAHRQSWRFILQAYLPRLALLSLVWELVQLPLYRLWAEHHWERIAFAVLHCTAGDLMIAFSALLIALILTGANQPRDWPKAAIVAFTIVLGLSYTVLSETMNLAQGAWSYSAWMPIVPWLNIGVAPVLQWVLVPLFSWWWSTAKLK